MKLEKIENKINEINKELTLIVELFGSTYEKTYKKYSTNPTIFKALEKENNGSKLDPMDRLLIDIERKKIIDGYIIPNITHRVVDNESIAKEYINRSILKRRRMDIIKFNIILFVIFVIIGGLYYANI